MIQYCFFCGRRFPMTEDDLKAASAEAERLFGVKDADKNACLVLVCDDCWKQVQNLGAVPKEDA